MKRIFAFIVILMIFRLFGTALNQNFKIVKIIGDDQSDCFFSEISDAILTPCKDVIILDARENFIARFDWSGNFINRIGQKGKGAGDFLWPTSADIFNGKLYILDRFNNRFAESDLELNNLRYFKLPQKIKMPRILTVLDEKNFLVDCISFNNPNDPKICTIEKTKKVSTKISNMFFEHTPIEVHSKSKDDRTASRLGPLFGVVYAMDDNKEKMLITFGMPGNLMLFFLYTVKGELIKKFSYRLDEKYHFPHYLYKSKKLTLSSIKGRYGANVYTVFYYNNHWYIFVNTHHHKDVDYETTISNIKKHRVSKSFYLKFGETGKLVGKFYTDPYFLCFHISKDGYVLGKHPGSEAEQLVIYKMLRKKI
jgi:hypothetical protein